MLTDFVASARRAERRKPGVERSAKPLVKIEYQSHPEEEGMREYPSRIPAGC